MIEINFVVPMAKNGKTEHVPTIMETANEFIAILNANGSGKLITVEHGDLSKLPEFHNTQDQVNELMKYNCFYQIGDSNFAEYKITGNISTYTLFHNDEKKIGAMSFENNEFEMCVERYIKNQIYYWRNNEWKVVRKNEDGSLIW